MKYTIKHGDNAEGTPGTLHREFADDDEAKRFVRKLVEDGFRNSTWASVELPDSDYVIRNVWGKAVGGVAGSGQ